MEHSGVKILHIRLLNSPLFGILERLHFDTCFYTFYIAARERFEPFLSENRLNY